MTMQVTTPALELIECFEGYKSQAYYCPAGRPTIGIGTTTYADGESVQMGDEISEDDAKQELFWHIRKEVEPALNKLVSRVLQPNQVNALASFAHNLGTDAKKYPTLLRLINDGAEDFELIEQWVKYRNRGSAFELGLYRRRLAELCQWFGLPWEAALEAHLSDDPVAFINAQQPNLVESPSISTEPEPMSDLYEGYEDPTPEDDWTTADYNEIQRRKLAGDHTGFVRVVGEKRVVTVRAGAAKAGDKPVEESTTARGYAKATSGKEKGLTSATVIGGATVAAAVSKDAKTTIENTTGLIGSLTMGDIITMAFLIGIPLGLWGLWQYFTGEAIKERGRNEATGGKV